MLGLDFLAPLQHPSSSVYRIAAPARPAPSRRNLNTYGSVSFTPPPLHLQRHTPAFSAPASGLTVFAAPYCGGPRRPALSNTLHTHGPSPSSRLLCTVGVMIACRLTTC